MSINTAGMPTTRYEGLGFCGEGGLVQPSAVVFVKNLNRLLGDRRGSAAALADFCKLNRSAVTKWRDGDTFPSADSLDKIAEFFGVPVSLLFEDPTDDRSTGLEIEKAIRMVIEAAKKGSSQ